VTSAPDIIPDGLPDHLPEGERLLWQGRPDWMRMAIDAYHVRKVAIYFAAVILGQAVYRLGQGESFASAFGNLHILLACAAAACGILALIAYASARTTRYALTSKRALMRIGIALPINVNIPYAKVDGVVLALTGGGCGTICFKPDKGTRLAYFLLWPHAKPWSLSKPQPAFRNIANAEGVATLLVQAMGGRMPQAPAPAFASSPQIVAAE
jgi:hypothetical protein